MKQTNARKMKEIVHQVALKDDVNMGVAKARFAGKANYSVPSLERLMRGEKASDDQIAGTLVAAKAWKIEIDESQLFPPVSAGEEEAS